ncbi:MAG: hypothetical protein CVV49_04105 [Spirochaetae bacterium HGW-Spirochaetae-5]|nr:MAG: hypothetical protein CVV49_04105 [Spirochaetae bacterium HGW-Spirochaetae-5]
MKLLMDKLRMETTDMTEQNIEKIGILFLNVITESRDKDGKLENKIQREKQFNRQFELNRELKELKARLL